MSTKTGVDVPAVQAADVEIADRLLNEARTTGHSTRPLVRSFDNLCEVVEAMEKAHANPEGFWEVGGQVGYVQKLSGVWHFRDPVQGWREITCQR